jgi:beta-lactamase superfamily II metal-dependent hydrolase
MRRLTIRYSQRFAVALLLLSLWTTAAAQLTVLLGLHGPGQATVHIDSSRKTAHIVDLGNRGDGDKIELGGKPLLDILQSKGISKLVFTCSHPHTDHAGGIRALFERRDSFFFPKNPSKSRFKSITVIDDGYPESQLSTILKQTFAKEKGLRLQSRNSHESEQFVVKSRQTDATLIRIQHKSATDQNAFSGISEEGDSLFIRNVPYKTAEPAGPHGRSVVTYTTNRDTRGHEYNLLNFDDANSTVVQAVVEELQSDLVTKIRCFVVPHHGSKFQDLDPIFRLRPDTAIIAVNPKSQYGHPTLDIVKLLAKRLGAKNVLFTGSDQNLIIGPEGIQSAKYSAADPVALRMFLGDADANDFERSITVDSPIMDESERESIKAMVKQPKSGSDTTKSWTEKMRERAKEELKILEDVIDETDHE